MADHVEDSDIIFVEEKSSKWKKWAAPNPILTPVKLEETMKAVGAKLNMQNHSLSNASSECSKKDKIAPHKSLENIPMRSLQKTPDKGIETNSSLQLTPEEILDLTNNCLDSDNEPEMTPSQPSENKQSSTEGGKHKRNLQFDSRELNFPAACSSIEGISIKEMSATDVNTITKSPSPKKRRLTKNSPIRFLPSHQNIKRKLSRSPAKGSPTKLSPNKSLPSPSKVTHVLNNTNSGESLMALEGPYYYEAFCFIMKKVNESPEYDHLFLESEKIKLQAVPNFKKEFQLYVRLLNRKDKWNRCSDIVYNDISPDLTPLFDFLEMQQLIACDLHDVKLEVLLHLLKLDELKSICSKFKVKKSSSKGKIIPDLIKMHETQPTLGGGVSPLRQSICAILGRCVRLTPEWRRLFQRCILMFSLFHSNGDLDVLTSEQTLLLLEVNQKKMIFPLSEFNIAPCMKIFNNRDQFLRFEEAKQLKQNLENAFELKNFNVVKDLTSRVMDQFKALLQIEQETKHILQLPRFLQKFCAGSTYAYSLSHSIDALKQAKDHKKALEVLGLLRKQKIYYSHYQGKWALMEAEIQHINMKNSLMAFEVLCAALKDKSTLNFIDRMNLQQRAEKLLKLKKNGLNVENKAHLQNLIDPPSAAPDVVEINARAYLSQRPGSKKTYIRDTDNGKEFMSVEETVLAHYRSLGFTKGVHDEGSTISSLCLLSLWNLIYDHTIYAVFQSPYQDRPLDWGSKDFYERRKSSIEAHFKSLLQKDSQSVAKDLNGLLNNHSQKNSLVNWDRLEHLDIQNFLECISVPVFVAISRRLVEDWKSHRRGFPDLVIWSPLQKKSLFIEVKSPNDHLSTVQILWLDFLKKYGANAFVAHIRESGSKFSQQSS